MSATEVLQKVPLFSQLSPADLGRVVEVARDRAYPKNSVILFEDDELGEVVLNVERDSTS